VLIGGQAIALWSAQLADYLPEDAEPVSSRDLDFQGSRDDVELAARLLSGESFIAAIDDFTPMTGKAVFLDSDGHKRTLDFLAQPYGLDAEDVDKTAIEIEVIAGDRTIPLWVMHPERCLRSRVANSALPNKQTDLAWRQLTRAIECVHAFGLLLLDVGESPRVVTQLNERVFELAYHDRRARKIYADRGIDVLDALIDDDRLSDAHRQIRLPQMRQLVTARRDGTP